MWQVIVFTALLAPVFAATPFKKALDTKKNIYIDKGTFIGGQAGQAFSLLKVRSQADPKKGMERVVLNIGDEQGRILKGRVSFFQVNLEPENSRLVISLSQVGDNKVSQKDLANTFKKSPFVKGASFVADAEGNSTLLILDLKRKVRAEVFQMKQKGTPGRLVVDLKAKR